MLFYCIFFCLFFSFLFSFCVSLLFGDCFLEYETIMFDACKDGVNN